MKLKTLVVILILSGACQNLLSQITPEDYAHVKLKELARKYTKKEGEFSYSLVPVSSEQMIAQQYPKWKEKRYDEKMMSSNSKDIIAVNGNDFHVLLVITFVGDWTSGKDKTIPSDLAEYVFLENTNGEFTRCRAADVPMFSKINILNESVIIHLVFSTELPGTNRLLTDGMDKIIIVVGGVGIKNNKFEFDIPISSLYLDAPTVLKDLYYNSGLWERNE